nr:hypothetical protein [Tanacetum cinerariifolium]
DSNSSVEEIDLTFTLDDPIPPSIEENDDDSRDILIHEELPDNYSLPLPENESFHFDIPSFSHPPAKPPDGDIGILNIKMMGDVSDQKHVTVENKANKTAGPKEANNSKDTQDNIDARNSNMEAEHEDQAFLEELERLKRPEKEVDDAAETLRKTFAQSTEDFLLQAGAFRASSTNYVNDASTPVNTASTPVNAASMSVNTTSLSRHDIYEVPNDGIFTRASYDEEGAVADFTNLESTVNVSPMPQSKIHSIHPTTQILGDPNSTVLTSSKVNKSSRAHAFLSYIQKQRLNNHKDFQHCLFACFLSQIKPKNISQALEDESWVNAMQEELLQFKTQQVWILVDLTFRKKVIGTKWVYRNKKDERGVVVRNKARLVAQGHRQEEEIMIFLAFASYMRFIIYQMDVKSAFLYGKIDEEVHKRGLVDKALFIKKDKKDIMLVQVYVDDVIFGSTMKSWCDEFEALIKSRFLMSSIGELTFFLGLQTASTPIKTKKPLVKDAEAVDVDVHLYRSMIGSLMYLTASRPDIMYAVCACSSFQVTPNTSHLHAVKRIFRNLKGQPKLGLL